jgi:hypothetical protein
VAVLALDARTAMTPQYIRNIGDHEDALPARRSRLRPFLLFVLFCLALAGGIAVCFAMLSPYESAVLWQKLHVKF